MDEFEIPVTDEQVAAPPTKFWKTIRTIEVLTQGNKPPYYDNLDELAYDISHGDASGGTIGETQVELTAQEMADALDAHGSDPEFLGIQVDGDNKVVPKFYVKLSARADVRGFVEVNAEDEEAAFRLAEKEAKDGNVEWSYDGVHDHTISAVSSS